MIALATSFARVALGQEPSPDLPQQIQALRHEVDHLG